MNYYPHHIGDYAKDTGHLSWDEDMAYTRLLRAYYSREGAIPQDQTYRLARASTGQQKKAVDSVLAEFFTLESDGWHNKRADAELAIAHEKSEKARTSAAKRWQSNTSNANAMRTHSEGNAKAMLPITNNQEPVTNSQQPLAKGKDKTAVADATRGDPVKEEIWKTGRAILEGQGSSTQAAGAFLGKLCKEYGQILVLDAVRDCKRVTPAEAKAWLTARCQERRKGGTLEERNLAATAGWKPPEAMQ